MNLFSFKKTNSNRVFDFKPVIASTALIYFSTAFFFFSLSLFFLFLLYSSDRSGWSRVKDSLMLCTILSLCCICDFYSKEFFFLRSREGLCASRFLKYGRALFTWCNLVLHFEPKFELHSMSFFFFFFFFFFFKQWVASRCVMLLMPLNMLMIQMGMMSIIMMRLYGSILDRFDLRQKICDF